VRYITRLALPSERVQTTAAGQVVLKLETPSRNGTTQLVILPLDFRQRLAAAVQRRRRNQAMTASRLSISAVGRLEWVAYRCTRPEVDGLQFDAHRKFEARRPQCEVQQPFGSVFSRAAVGHERNS